MWPFIKLFLIVAACRLLAYLILKAAEVMKSIKLVLAFALCVFVAGTTLKAEFANPDGHDNGGDLHALTTSGPVNPPGDVTSTDEEAYWAADSNILGELKAIRFNTEQSALWEIRIQSMILAALLLGIATKGV